MKTDKISVADLFEKPRRYLIPLFQRGYVWTLVGQWAPLWQDVMHQVKEVRRARAAGTRDARRHFLGAVVLNQNSLGVRYTAASDVIDGQQRLTTLQVILVAFRDAVAPLANEFLTARLTRLTQNPGPWPDEAERYKVWPTSVFRDDFRSVADAGSPKAIEERFPLQRIRRKWIPRPPLADAYLYFFHQIATFLRTEKGLDEELDSGWPGTSSALDAPYPEEAQTRAEDLLDALTRHVQLVEINLDQEDDPQIIFETLNARGAPLQPSDLIRNFVFLYATRRGEDVVNLYDSYWRAFDEDVSLDRKSETKKFWRDAERQGRFKVSRLDLFFFHYLSARTGTEFKIGHIFEVFREWWEGAETPRSAATELAAIQRSARVFKKLIVPDRATAFGGFADRLKILDTTTAYPLVLAIEMRKERLPPGEFERALALVESYLVRRAVCSLTPKGYNRIFLAILRTLKEADDQALASALERELLSQGGESGSWPSDSEFGAKWRNEPLYEQLNGAKIRMLLETIELAMRGSKQENVSISGDLSVEHIMPQWATELAWPNPAKQPDGTIDPGLNYRRERLKHRMGNLTLVTPSFNSSLSNASFAQKQPALVRESLLRLNSYFLDVAPPAEWDESAIEKRGAYLLAWALKVWPRREPTAPGALLPGPAAVSESA